MKRQIQEKLEGQNKEDKCQDLTKYLWELLKYIVSSKHIANLQIFFQYLF